MSSGSREVLLACSWLLVKTNILTDFMMDDRVQMADTAHLHLEEVQQVKMIKEESCQTLHGRTNETIMEDRRPSQCAKQLAWLVGRCRMKMRRLHLQQQELYNLIHQIHVATQGLSISTDTSHLSPLETFIIRHTQQLKKHQEFLEAEQTRLNVCIKWQEQQATFWQWMESVLDAKLQDSSGEGEETGDFLIPNLSPRSDSLPHLLKELEGHTLELEHLLEDDDLGEDNDYTSKELLITEDIRTNLIPPSSAPSRHAVYQRTRFHLATKQSKLPASAQSTHGNPSNKVHIQEEIARLTAVVDRLHHEVDNLRRDHCRRMDDLTSVLPDAVCIPPMGSAR